MNNRIRTPEEILSFRIQQGMRRKQLRVKTFAKAIGRTSRSVNNWINLRSKCNETLYPKIAEVLEMPFHYLSTQPSDLEVFEYEQQTDY